MEIVEERVLLKDLPLVDVHTRDGPVIGALLVVRIKQTLKALSPAWTASATPSQVLPMEPGYDLEAGVINKPTVLCSAGHALLEDILCLQELQKQHPWFETMISEIQKGRFFTRNHVVITPLEHMDEDGAVKMGMSFVPTLRMKSQPAGGVLMWVNQYPALKELSQTHKFLIPMFNVIAVHILMSAPWGVKLRAGFGAAVSVFDAFTDVFMLIRYLGEEGYQDYAIMTGMLLGMSMVLQFFVVVFQNSKAKHPLKTIAYETLPIIFCLKPVVDAYRVATSHQMEKHKRFDQLTEMGMTRGVEMFSESIPQAILQTYVYISIVQTGDISGSFAILLTIFSSVLSASYCSANMSYDFDISPKSRAKNERFYGYIPDAAKGRTIVFFSLIASSSFHLLLKCVSSALLCIMGFKYVGMFILGDILFFFAYKLARRDFYHWIPMDNKAMTIFVTVMLRAVIKIITDFTAIVQFRNSVDLGGAFWTYSQFMSQAGAFVIVWVYFSTDHSAGWDDGQEDRFWMVMFALLLGYLVSIAAFLSNIKSEFFHTFFNINTAYGEIRANFFEGGDEAKCEAVFTNSKYHTAAFQDDVKKWVQENWMRWQETRPLWLEDWVVAKIPKEWIPDEGKCYFERRRVSVVAGVNRDVSQGGILQSQASVVRMQSSFKNQMKVELLSICELGEVKEDEVDDDVGGLGEGGGEDDKEDDKEEGDGA